MGKRPLASGAALPARPRPGGAHAGI